ncbi:MAG TPA: hypothetical protein VGD75_08375, partial [Bradyrhizobium sp.]
GCQMQRLQVKHVHKTCPATFSEAHSSGTAFYAVGAGTLARTRAAAVYCGHGLESRATIVLHLVFSLL